MRAHSNRGDEWLAVLAIGVTIATVVGFDRVAADLRACTGLSHAHPRAVAAAVTGLIAALLLASIRWTPGIGPRVAMSVHLVVLGLVGACAYAELCVQPSVSVAVLVGAAIVGLLALLQLVDDVRNY